MPKTKHSARKQVTGGLDRVYRRGGSDDSQEQAHPQKRAACPPSSSSDSSLEGSDFEDELEEVEPAPFVGVRVSAPKPSTRRPTFQPPPPPVQTHGDARHISLEPPLPLGRHIKHFNEVPTASYRVAMLISLLLLGIPRIVVFAPVSKPTSLPLLSFLKACLSMSAFT